MALNGAGLASEIQSALTGLPWTGTELTVFCNAIGQGIVTNVSGTLLFTTSDTGQIPGSGAGVGVGITGLSPVNIADTIFNIGQGFWAPFQNNGPGDQWRIFCDTVAVPITSHFAANATLTSTHAPVFAGSGTVTAYSGITAAGMTGAITALAPPGWQAARFPELAEAVATGVVTEILGHSPADTVVISGSPSGDPEPGSGSGAGVVT